MITRSPAWTLDITTGVVPMEAEVRISKVLRRFPRSIEVTLGEPPVVTSRIRIRLTDCWNQFQRVEMARPRVRMAAKPRRARTPPWTNSQLDRAIQSGG